MVGGFGIFGKKAQLSERPSTNTLVNTKSKPSVARSSNGSSSVSQPERKNISQQTPSASFTRSRQVSFFREDEILVVKPADEKKSEEQYERVPTELISEAIVALVKDGVLLDFKSNPQIKHNSNPDSGATTENPGKVGFTRDNAVIYIEGKESRTKMIKYGNFNAIHEVLSQKLYELTGLKSPHTKLMVGLDGVFADKLNDKSDAEKNKQSGVPNLYVSSPIVPGYQDLGDFLLNGAQYFFDAKQKAKWEEEKSMISKLKKSKTVDGETKRKILHHHFAIYEMLPDYVHAEIEKSFAAGKFVANWDFANFDLKNIGCRFVLEGIRIHNPIKFESVFVDFGNSGVLGFGGKVKELSLERANTEAKPVDRNISDSDPALAFNEEEKRFLKSIGEEDLQKGLKAISSYDLTQNPDKKELIASVIFKASHQINRQEASHEISRSAGLITISDLPRNLPFGALFRKAIEQKSEAVFEGDHSKSKWRDGEIEMAFRLSLIKDETIFNVVNKWNLCGRFPEVFSYAEGVDVEKYNSDALSKAFIERKNHLMNSIPRNVVDEWIANNPYLAIAAQREVLLGNLDAAAVGSNDVLQSDNSVERRISFSPKGDDKQKGSGEQREAYSYGLRPAVVKNILEERKSKIQEPKNGNKSRGLQDYEDSVSALTQMKEVFEELDETQKEKLRKPLDLFSDITNRRKLRLDQKNLEDVLGYAETHSRRWAKFNTTPNCSFFDVKTLREIYRKQCSSSVEKEDGKIRTADENDSVNSTRHAENQWVYDQFTKSLDLCSSLELRNQAKFPTFSALVKKTIEAKTI